MHRPPLRQYKEEFYSALVSLDKLEHIYFHYTDIDKIPYHAFDNTNKTHNSSKEINIDFGNNQYGYKYSWGGINSTGEYMIYYLDNLKTFSVISSTSVFFIPQHCV